MLLYHSIIVRQSTVPQY